VTSAPRWARAASRPRGGTPGPRSPRVWRRSTARSWVPAARLFRNANFRSLWLGQLVSIFGDRLQYLALLSLLVEGARDPRNPAPELALVPVVSFLPTILIGPVAGALVDGWDTRRVLLVSDFLRGCVVLLTIPAALRLGLPAAFAMVFLLYLVNSFFLPARSAILPDLVEPEDLVEANSLATLAGVLATIAGSLLGGFLVERVGWKWGFGFDAVTYFVSVLFLAALRPRARERRARPPDLKGLYGALGRDVKEGASLTVRNRAVLGPLLALVLLWMAGGVLHVAGTTLLRQRLHTFVSGTGGLLSAVGFGMVAGTLLTAWTGQRLSARGSMAAGLAGTGVALLVFARAYSLGALLAVAFAAGSPSCRRRWMPPRAGVCSRCAISPRGWRCSRWRDSWEFSWAGNGSRPRWR